MESFGAWGLIPPLLAIVLAFVTKDVIVSLFLGILSGALIIAGGNLPLALMKVADAVAASLADGWNIRVFSFCALLGSLVGLLTRTGAASAFGRWASSRLKTSKGAAFTSFIFGIIIFIDDYFNSLTVGTIMRPISDKTKMSRAKLAYILDSTAAPVCIIAPVSSWVVTVMSIVKGAEGFDKLGLTPFEFFIRSIPYNLYALGTLAFVVAIIMTKRDFGPMAASEQLAKDGTLYNEEKYGPVSGNVGEDETAKKNASPFDMLFPIIALIIAALIFFPVTTWISAVDGKEITTFAQAVQTIPLSDAFKDTDASVALFYAIIVTIFLTYIYFLARGLLKLLEAADAFRDGMKSMVSALIILAMAWTIGSIIKASPDEGGLGLGKWLSLIVVKGNFPLAAIPAVVFVLSAIISFATGTSWGTFGIMIPLVMPIVTSLAEAKGLAASSLTNAAMMSVAAVVGGAVFGDHSSPISDTTILSSTGAGCPHLEHVATQMPYALCVAACALLSFLIGALFGMNMIVSWIAFAALLFASLVFLPRRSAK